MAKQTIKLKKYVDIINEYVAGGAVKPGHVVVLGSGGTVAVGAAKTPLIALEDELQGRAITDAFASGEPIQCWTPVRGEEGLCILSTSQTIAIGAVLEANASGELIALNTGTAVAIAFEAVTTTAAVAFIKVRFM